MSETDQPPTKHDTAPRRRLLTRGRLLLCLTGAIVGLGVWWWLDAGRHLFFPKNWGVVEEGRIYRSGRIHRRIVKDVLEDEGIRVVIDLAGTDQADPNFEPERVAARELDIEHHTFKTLDGYGIGKIEDYLQAFTLLLEAKRDNKPILVHCGGGSERTGATFAWYRMLLDGWDGPRAWEEYLHYRARAVKSDDLMNFVNEHFPVLIERLKSKGLIDEAPNPLPVFGPKGTVSSADPKGAVRK